MDGVAAHPRPRRVRTLPAQGDLHPQRALAPCLQLAAGGFAEDGHVAGEQVGPVADEVGEAVVLGGDLLARVEDVGDVDGGIGDGLGEGEHHRQAALHVGAAEAPQHVAVDAGVGVAVHRHGVGVAGEDHPHRTVEVGPGDEVGADPLDREVRLAAETGLEVIDERSLGVAHRRDRHQIGRGGEEVGCREARCHGAHARYGEPP